MPLEARPLTPETWPAFAALAEAHNGVWNGCWCLDFHERFKGSADERRAKKAARVAAGQAHASLVFDGPACVGWAQYGNPSELPCIKNRKAYEATLKALPAWRITCLFVGKTHRKQGVADHAIAAALTQIAQAGGGRIEAYPEDTAGRKVSASFSWSGSVALFERHGFRKDRQIGKHKWVVTRTSTSAS